MCLTDPTWSNLSSLGADVALALIPFVPAGVGFSRNALSHADDIYKAGKSLINTLDDVTTPMTKLLTKVDDTSSVWKLNPFERGLKIEKLLGANMGNYPVIDKFSNGVATSIKSIDLDAKSYQNLSTLQRTLGSYVDEIAQFQGQKWGEFDLRFTPINKRVLELAVTPGASYLQREVIDRIVSDSQRKGVDVIIHIVE